MAGDAGKHRGWTFDPAAIVEGWGGRGTGDIVALDASTLEIVAVGPGVLVRAAAEPGAWTVSGWLAPQDVHDHGTIRLLLAVAAANEPPAAVFRLEPDADLDAPLRVPSTIRSQSMESWALRASVWGVRRRHNTGLFAARFPGGELEDAGGAMPFQAEGTWHGHPFYFRYRHGSASLSLAGPGGDPVGRPLWEGGVEHGDPMDGALTFPEFLDLYEACAANLDRAAHVYQFPQADGPDLLRMRAEAAAGNDIVRGQLREAHLAHPPAVVRARTFEEALIILAVEEERRGIRYHREPFERDKRVWPDVAPPFLDRP